MVSAELQSCILEDLNIYRSFRQSNHFNDELAIYLTKIHIEEFQVVYDHLWDDHCRMADNRDCHTESQFSIVEARYISVAM